MTKILLLSGLLVALSLGWAGRSLARAPADQVDVRQLLRIRMTLSWQGQQMGAALDRIRAATNAPLWVDRRVDLSAPVELALQNATLEQVLTELAAGRQLAATTLGGVIFFGPQQNADELATLAALARDQVNRLPVDARRRWLTAEAWSWPRLSEPRQLLIGLADAARTKVLDQELVGHDLWPARVSPPLTRIDRAVLLLSGFDLTCEFSRDGRELRVTPIRRPVRVLRTYNVPANRQAAVDQLLSPAATAEVQRNGSRWQVAARAEDHARLQSALQNPRPAQSRGGEASEARTPPAASRSGRQVFTLNVKNKPLGVVLDQLARQLEFSVEWDPRLSQTAPNPAARLASCDVVEAELDELLDALVTSAGLSFVRDDRRVVVQPDVQATEVRQQTR